MWIPKEIGRMATRLKEGHRVNRITVRELLRMFKAERRGLNKVHDIRTALDSLGLVTDPDFESVWIDKKIRIRLKDASNLVAAVPPAGNAGIVQEDELDEEQSLSDAEQDETDSQQPGSEEGSQPAIVLSSEGVVETVLSEPADPTFRIGSLPAANKALTTVGQDDHLKKAVTMMLQFDYSQLPIMHGEREVKGMISWKSIASRYAIGGECCKVQHCREDAQVVDGNGTLFDAIPTIVKHGYVLVRNPQDRKITGIVTASDLSLQFQQLAEPFLLLREIELHIRQLLQDKVLAEDLDWLGSADTTAPKPNSISDLSFGGYIRLVQRPQVWQRLALNIDQASLTKQLEDVRQIRNDVMHFDPDPLTPKQLDVLKNAAKFMQQLYELLP
jgi:predicted transcriptional regulator